MCGSPASTDSSRTSTSSCANCAGFSTSIAERSGFRGCGGRGRSLYWHRLRDVVFAGRIHGMVSIGPFAEISRIQSEINRLFDNLLELRSGGGDGESGGTWLPSADVYETDAALVVKFEVPGVALDDVTMSVDGNRLVLRGEKRRPEPGRAPRGGRFHCMERGY